MDVVVVVGILCCFGVLCWVVRRPVIAFGICFQLPVVLTLLAKVGIVGSVQLKKGRKYAIVLTFLIAAFLTPPDLVSQIGLAIPTILLYEFSILLVLIIEKNRETKDK